MAASVQSFLLLTYFQVTEDPGSEPAGVALTSLYKALDQLVQLTSTSTPAVAMFGAYATAISGGTYTIDVTALQGTNGALDCTAKKLIAACVVNPAASAGEDRKSVV